MRKILLLSCLLFISSAAKATDIAWGDSSYIGKAEIRGFSETDSNKRLVSLGVGIRQASLENLPHEDKRIIIRLPNSKALAPYKFIEVNWNTHGHEPPGIYNVPHFDFHFYVMPLSQVEKITCAGADRAVCLKTPPPNYVAANYAPGPEGVPKMGNHWIDTLAPEFNGGKFSKTFIYGYYDGKVNFLEPMVTLEHLLSGAISTNPIRQPEAFAVRGSYPRAYEVTYDSVNKIHYVRLKNFKRF